MRILLLNPLQPDCLYIPLESIKKVKGFLMFSEVSPGYRKAALGCNGLRYHNGLYYCQSEKI